MRSSKKRDYASLCEEAIGEPFEVTVTGIDGSGKSTTISHLVDRLSPEYLVAKSGRPSYIVGPGMDGREYLFESRRRVIDGINEIGDSIGSRTAIGMANIAYVGLWRGMHEKIAREYDPDIMFSGRHRVIDSVVYATYYFPWISQLSLEKRLSLIKSVAGEDKPDLLIYLELSPETAVHRIEGRIEKEKKEKGLVRPKWRHMHETIDNLIGIREEYRAVLDYHRSLGWNIHVVNVEESPQSEVVDTIETLIRENF